jgi:hypothetical protein
MFNTSFYTRAKVFMMPLLLSALSFAFSTSAFAGSDATSGLAGGCYQSGGIQVCYGTMAGIRNQTVDPSRAAGFGYTSSGTAYFFMTLNGASYLCYAPSSMNDTIKTAMASSGYFLIEYTISTGTCTYLALEAGTSEKNASNL